MNFHGSSFSSIWTCSNIAGFNTPLHIVNRSSCVAPEGCVSWYLNFLTLQIPLPHTLLQGSLGCQENMCNGVCFLAFNVWTCLDIGEGELHEESSPGQAAHFVT
jgi:hypothetical protein